MMIIKRLNIPHFFVLVNKLVKENKKLLTLPYFYANIRYILWCRKSRQYE